MPFTGIANQHDIDMMPEALAVTVASAGFPMARTGPPLPGGSHPCSSRAARVRKRSSTPCVPATETTIRGSETPQELSIRLDHRLRRTGNSWVARYFPATLGSGVEVRLRHVRERSKSFRPLRVESSSQSQPLGSSRRDACFQPHHDGRGLEGSDPRNCR